MPEKLELGFYETDNEEIQRDYNRDQKGGGNDANLFFLRQGVTQLRILPAYSEKGVWYRELREHAARQNGNYSPVLCLRTNDQDCPFCEHGQELYNEGGEASVEAAREFRPRSSFLFNVVVFSEPNNETNLESGVQVLKAGVKVKRQILELDQDAADWGDITNLHKGVNLKIKRSGKGQFDTEYLVNGMPKRTDIVETFKEKGIPLSKLKPANLDEVMQFKSYEEAKLILKENLDKMGFGVQEEKEKTDKVPESEVKTEVPF